MAGFDMVEVRMESDVPAFLREFEACHLSLTKICDDLMVECRFISDAELLHHIVIEAGDGSVTVESLHRFSLASGREFERADELAVRASISFVVGRAELALVAVVDLEEAVGRVAAGTSVLWRLDDEARSRSPLESVEQLRSELERLPDLRVLFSDFLVPRA